ncbi:MAG: diguanylate cyclase [Methylobacter sp.]|nr:diguanylate cyclase [Methylobacter sp.]MDP2097316.1 diguanylate cyclase [Methylobacter sp.]MDP2428378.1 diguanylate cyclase [Methylobacter sp.]MDP3053221.1 diguanylate cyclase [Methylobacter sp.]MDP3362363.1 diguanylate cyclase [Methylobacter sp.]
MTKPTHCKGTILLVDDLPENLQLLSELLTQLGYTVRSVTSGRMALKTLAVKQPDLIFLDIQMPEMDGYQVCSAIKADEKLRDIPIIFISALDDTFDKVKAFECGGVDYISKPFHIEEVVARAESQLVIQRQKNALQEEVCKRQEAEALLASVLNSALNGIAALQAVRNLQTGEIEDFRCLVANAIIAEAFNKNTEELITNRLIFKDFINQINADLLPHFIALVESGEPLENDFYYPLGESCWYHFVAVKLGDGFAITIGDITIRKKMELELQQANHELQLLAHLDGLTKIANRRCFDGFLAKEWQRLQRERQPFSLLMLDVDYFKLYNDNYGHLQGDDCLIQMAQTLEKVVSRPADLAARYGGEEFVVILPGTDQTGAVVIAEAIQAALQALAIAHEYSTVSDVVTVSIGIACMIPFPGMTSDDLIKQADDALYSAKQLGRNKFVVAAVQV